MSDSTGGKAKPTRWSDVFSRLSVGPHCYFVKGTRRSHDTGGTERLEHDAFVRIREICGVHNFASWDRFDGGPGARRTYVQRFAFLEGGMLSVDSDAFAGWQGAWVFGDEAVRFLCFELGVAPPAPRGLSRPPRPHEELRRES